MYLGCVDICLGPRRGRDLAICQPGTCEVTAKPVQDAGSNTEKSLTNQLHECNCTETPIREAEKSLNPGYFQDSFQTGHTIACSKNGTALATFTIGHTNQQSQTNDTRVNTP